MVKLIRAQNQEEFEERLQNKDLRISKAIVEVVLKNLKGKKRFIPILEVHLKDEGQIFDITMDREDMLQTLKQNLQIHELHEAYEGCAHISKAIKELQK